MLISQLKIKLYTSCLQAGLVFVLSAGCDANLNVKTSNVSEPAAENPDQEEPLQNEEDKAPKISDENCVDPDLARIPTSVTFTLCDGSSATGKLDISELKAENLAAGTNVGDVNGIVPAVPTHCSNDGAVGCIATTAYVALNSTLLSAGDIRGSVSIAGVAGNYVDPTPACASNGDIGCLANPSYRAADLSNLASGNIRNGKTVAGMSGSYPSLITPLAGVSGDTELTSLNAATAVGNYQFFDSAGNHYTGAISDAGAITPSHDDQVFAASLYKPFSVAGDAALTANNIRAGVSLFGVTGNVAPAPAACSSNSEVGCIANATYQAANLTNLNAGNIKLGVTIAGVNGQYPSSAHRLAGADATTDLPAFSATTGGSAYEWFQADGTRVTGSIENNATLTPATTNQVANAGLYRSVTVVGDSDLSASNIKDAVNLFGVSGTLTPNPNACTANGEIGCVANSSYKAADLSNALAGNIKNSVTIAGISGTYPSLATPLAGASGVADLTSLATTTAAGNYEFFDAAGARYVGDILDAGTIIPSASNQNFNGGIYRQFSVAGDADLTGTNIKSGATIFGVAGSMIPIPADCSSNAEVGCVSTSTFKAADLTNLSVGNIKNGVTLAGVTGSYPSAGYLLPGATGTADLPAFASVTSGTGYEWYQADGSRITGTIENAATVNPGVSTQTLNAGLYRSVTVNGDSNLTANNVRNGVDLFGVIGNVIPPTANCTADGESDCVVPTAGSYKAADMANVIPSNIKSGVVIAGVTGTLSGVPANCGSNGAVGCVATATYQSANLANLVSGNIKNGVTLAGTGGTYPSLATPLATATATADLTGLAASTAAGPYEFFDSAGARYTGNIADAGTITPGTTSQTFNTALYRQFTVSGDADLIAANVKNGITLYAVSGSLTPSPANCTADSQTACVATSVYKAADTGAFVAGDLKSGKTAAGVAGTITNCAADGGGTCVVDGTTYKAAKMSNFVAGDIKSSVTIAGVAGSATLESHSNCGSDGATSCVAVAGYPAANSANVLAANIKSGVTIAGVAGQYPSATYPLPGAGATADLTNANFNAQVNNATAFEYWDSAGARQTGTGDANIAAANIISGTTVFGTAGSAVVETHAACSTDGGISCVPDGTTYKAAKLANFTAPDVKSGVTVAGVAGSATMESHSNCAADGATGCVAIATYKSALGTNVAAGNIKSGVVIGGVTGQYPSATYTLSNASSTADLTSGTFSTQIKSGTAFEYWDSTGTRQVGAGDANIVAAKILNGTTIFGTTGSVTAEVHSACAADGASGCYTDGTNYKAAKLSNFTAADVKTGVTIAAVAGSSALEAHSNCGSDGASNCIVNGTNYKAASTTTAVAGNIRSGITIAGIAGQYPSATYPLTGADSTADLDLATFNTKIKSATAFEWFDAAGTRYTGAGDADIQAANIAKDISIFGTTGTATAAMTCGGAGDGCYDDAAAIAAGSITTPSGKSLVYVLASTGFYVWKDASSSKILRANGMDEWAMKLNIDGKGQMAAGNEFTSYTSLVGRKCPPNVYLDDSNRATTDNCLYYTSEASAQGLDAAGTSQTAAATLGLGTWNTYSGARWYIGNIKTCGNKGMRLPTMFETATTKTTDSYYPTVADGSRTFAGATNGIPSHASGNTWTATASGPFQSDYWYWNGASTAATNYYYTSYYVRCVLP